MKNLFGETVKVSEGEILSSITQFLSWKGIYHWRNNSGAYKQGERYIRFGKKGTSDILALFPGELKNGLGKGLLWAIEVKKPGGRLSDEQIQFLKDVRIHGGIATVAESVEDVERTLIDMRTKMGERYERAMELSTGR